MIEEKLVRMKMENADLKRKAAESTSIFNALKNTFKKSDDLNYSKSINSLRALNDQANKTNFKLLEKAADTIISRFSVMGEVGTRALHSIITQAKQAANAMDRMFGKGAVRAGFQEYELTTNSIKTMLANMPNENVKSINKALDELNQYADDTVYSFKDMTDAIGRFSTSGLGLDKSVSMTKGLANLAATAGANTTDLARAYYQLSQGISSGVIRLQDWRSLVNANMGTRRFRQDLIDAAVAAGELKEAIDISQFESTLEKKWLTSDVMGSVLSKYAEDESMKKNATTVRTFTQLKESLQEAMGSGWARTWRLILGDFDEATELFTTLSNSIGEAFTSMGERRNKLLEDFNKIGGRDELMKGLAYALEAIFRLTESISKAFHNIFPPQTAESLLAIVKGFSDFMNRMILSSENAKVLEHILTGVFALIKSGIVIIKEAGSQLLRLFPPNLINAALDLMLFLSDILIHFHNVTISGGGVVQILRQIGDVLEVVGLIAGHFLQKFVDWVRSVEWSWSTVYNMVSSALVKIIAIIYASGVQIKNVLAGLLSGTGLLEGISSIFKGIVAIFTGLGGAIKQAFIGTGPLISTFKTAFSDFGTAVGGVADGVGGVIQWLLDLINRFLKFGSDIFGGLATGLGLITQAVGKFLNAVTIQDILLGVLVVGLWKLGKAVKGALEDVSGGLTKLLNFGSDNSIMKVAVGLLALAAGLAVISKLDIANIVKTLSTVGVLIAFLMRAMGKLRDWKGGGAKQLIALGITLRILAGAIKTMGSLDPGNVLAGLTALTVTMYTLSEFIKSVRHVSLQPKEIFRMIGIVAAIRLLSGEVKSLGQLNPTEALVGVIGLSAVIGAISIFLRSINRVKIGQGVVGSMIGLGVAMTLLLIPLKQLGSMQLEPLIQGSLALLSIISIMGLVVRLMSGTSIAGGAASILAFSLSLTVLLIPLKVLAGMDIQSLTQGMVSLAAVSGIIMLALGGLGMIGPGVAAASLSLIAFALAINLLVPAILTLGTVPWPVIAVGVGLLAASVLTIGLTIVGVLLVATPVVGAFVAALAPLGPISMMTSGGIALFGLGILALAAAFYVVATALPAAADGIVQFLVAINSSIDQLEILIINVAQSIVRAIVQAIVQGLIELGNGILEVLNYLKQWAPAASLAALEIVAGLISGLAAGLGLFVGACVEFIVKALIAMADAVVAYKDVFLAAFGLVMEAVGHLILSALRGIVESVNFFGWADDWLKDLDSSIATFEQSYAEKTENIKRMTNEVAKSFEKDNKEAGRSFDFISDGTEKAGSALDIFNTKVAYAEEGAGGLLDTLSKGGGMDMSSLLGGEGFSIPGFDFSGFSMPEMEGVTGAIGAFGDRVKSALSKINIPQFFKDMNFDISKGLDSILSGDGIIKVLEGLKQKMGEVDFGELLRQLGIDSIDQLRQGAESKRESVRDVFKGLIKDSVETAKEEAAKFKGDSFMADLFNSFSEGINQEEFTNLGKKLGYNFSHGIYQGEWMTDAGVEVLNQLQSAITDSDRIDEISKILGFDISGGLTHHGGMYATEAGSELMRRLYAGALTEAQITQLAEILGVEIMPGVVAKAGETGAEAGSSLANKAAEAIRNNNYWPEEASKKAEEAAEATKKEETFKSNAQANAEASKKGYESVSVADSATSITDKLAQALVSIVALMGAQASGIKVGEAVLVGVNSVSFTTAGSDFVTNISSAITNNTEGLSSTAQALVDGITGAITSDKMTTSGETIVAGYTQGIKDKASDIVEIGRAIVASTIRGIDLSPTNESGKGRVGDFISGIQEKASDLISAGKAMINHVKSGMESVSTTTAGASAGIAFATGVSGQSGKASFAGLKIAQDAIYGMRQVDASGAGYSLGEGFARGIGNSAWIVNATAQALAQGAANRIRSVLRINSPAKVMIPVGHAIGEGMIVGMTKVGQSVYSAASGLAGNVTSIATYAINKIRDRIGDDMTIRPVIKPVWDGSDIPDPRRYYASQGNSRVLGYVDGVANKSRFHGSGHTGNTVTVNNKGMLEGANFYIREEADIPKVAKEVVRIQKQEAELNHLFSLGKG